MILSYTCVHYSKNRRYFPLFFEKGQLLFWEYPGKMGEDTVKGGAHHKA